MKKKIIIFDKTYLNLKKNVILKNSLNYIFFKKLKYLHKKNLFLNFSFYNNFINLYKKNNLNIYKNNFFYLELNFFYIYNLNNFKKQFIYNLNFLKNFFENKNLKFLFFKKKINKSFYFNNCFFINSSYKNLNLPVEFNDSFHLIKLNLKKNNFNYLFFLNFNLFIFSLLEYYKIFILLYLNTKLIKKYI